MVVIGIICLVLAALVCAWACVGFAQNTWYTNCDLMGASIAFSSFWFVATVLLVAGLVLTGLLSCGAAIGTGFCCLVAGRGLQWFGLEPVLRGLFKDYGRSPASR